MSKKKKEPTIINLGIILLLIIALIIGICGIVSSTAININASELAKENTLGYSVALVCIAIVLLIGYVYSMVCCRKREDKKVRQLLLKRVPFKNESVAILISVSIPTLFVISGLLIIFL